VSKNTRELITVTDGCWSLSSDVADVDGWLPVVTIARIRRTFSASDSEDFADAELMRLFLRWCGVSRLCNRPSLSVKSSDNENPTLRVLPPSSSSSSSSSYNHNNNNYYYYNLWQSFYYSTTNFLNGHYVYCLLSLSRGMTLQKLFFV